MSDMPIQHEQPQHERRALRIAQLLEQAISAANADLSAPQNTIKAGITKHARWQRADRMIAAAILKITAAAIVIAGLCCILLAFLL